MNGAGGSPLSDFTTDRRVLTLSLMGVMLGAVSAVTAFLLVKLINLITNLSFHLRFSAGSASPDGNTLGAWGILVPAAGALLVGLMARYGSEKIRGHGIPEALEAILIGRSRIQARVAVLKPLSSAVSIGTGGPFGAEGPIIMTGGALGSLFAQSFHLSSAERKTLLVAGAAGGMSAIFASPVAAVLLAVELLLFEWKPRSFIPVACAAAAALRVPLLGAGPLFPVLPHSAPGGRELLVFLAIGTSAGLCSALLTLLVYGFEDLFGRLPIHWMWWPLLGGLVVGIGGLIAPRALGIGTESIRALLGGGIPPGELTTLLLVKAIIWSVALGSGTSGGVLAPLLLMGGALGAMETHALGLPDPGVWALAGMAAMMGGTMRCPFTAMVFAVELTRDVAVLPGLLVACVASDLVTVLLMRRSILTEKVARRGHHVAREYSVSPLGRVFVEEVMLKEAPAVPSGMRISELTERLQRLDPAVAPYQSWALVDGEGRLEGIASRGDLVESLQGTGGADRPVREAGTAHVVVAYPDELVDSAVEKMIRHDVGRLPVVAREDPRRLVGYLGRTGVMSAWAKGLEEERGRERGWLTSRLRLLRRKGRARFHAGPDHRPGVTG
jgi:chloride channel protein, CIC family